jgi:hypothetical protein
MKRIKKRRQTISVDFDGVIHSYITPWKAPHIIPDSPIPGAILWLASLVETFEVNILSTRALTWRGRRAIKKWLKRHSYGQLKGIKITAKKFPSIVYIDDRAYRFDGEHFPSIKELWQHKPWIKEREKKDMK